MTRELQELILLYVQARALAPDFHVRCYVENDETCVVEWIGTVEGRQSTGAAPLTREMRETPEVATEVLIAFVLKPAVRVLALAHWLGAERLAAAQRRIQKQIEEDGRTSG